MTIPPDMLEPLGVPPATQRRKRVPTPRAARNSVTKYATTSAPPCQDCGEEVVQQLLGGGNAAGAASRRGSRHLRQRAPGPARLLQARRTVAPRPRPQGALR